ncbi:MAG: electron transfer flavoprotein subunit beta/FixA family protein [Planctomycetota bacterium]|jgi:electron transfer flavoprotein beta subunit
MKIVVCVKRVPDTETRVKVAEDGLGIDPAGVSFVLNPYDEYAVEEAIRIKEKDKETEITVLCLGVGESTKEIRTALAMGCDTGVLIKDDAGPSRTPEEVAGILASALKGMEFDLLLFGKQAVDDDAAGVGTMVASRLGLPVVSFINGLELDGGKAVAKRDVEGGVETFELPLPAAFTASKGLNEPRLPALKGIMKAKKKKIAELTPAGGEVKTRIVKLELPAGRSGGKIVGEGPEAVPELVRLLKEEAKVL